MPKTDLTQSEAQACIAEIEKILCTKGQWYEIVKECNAAGVKFFRIKASIKVKQ
jgi:hypothetical protein